MSSRKTNSSPKTGTVKKVGDATVIGGEYPDKETQELSDDIINAVVKRLQSRAEHNKEDAKTTTNKNQEAQKFDPEKVDFSPVNNATKVLQEALNKAQGAGLFKTLSEATEVLNAAALLENVSRMALKSGAVRMERSAPSQS
ncbi:MAG: hypothetical protein HWE07_09235 [Cytophagia bacterium]|nr:hypothetical protein [Cytophagia bacterium]